MPSFTRTTRTRLEPRALALEGRTRLDQPAGLVILGRYRLHRPLGAGGFGAVWMARDERLERDVAVKMLARERVVGGRFEREARAAARLSHPAIVTLYEAAVDDDGAYLVSELVRGATLSQLLEAGRLSDRDIIEIGIELCGALAHAHAQGVVHRDVKPSNVLIPEPSNSGPVAKLTDFGIARVLGADTLTRTGDVVGTAAYMAPEQADGREAGAAADLYSLALVLYEALTGVNPIALGTPAQRARRLGAHLPPLRRQRRDLPGDLGYALDLALRPRARERGTVEELRAGLLSSLPRVDDQPGIVEPAWPGRTYSRAARDEEDHGDAPADDLPRPNRSPLRWPGRGLAGGAAGLTVAWLVTLLPGVAPGAPALAGLTAGLLVAALPRIGWLASAASLAAALAVQHRPGAAIVVGLAALVPVLLMPRHRVSWPLAAAAAGLGAVGLAGAWPALAGRRLPLAKRFGLGATGWIWTAAAGFLAGRGLYTRLPARLPAAWMGSLPQAAQHALARPGLLAPAVLWGLAAVLVPWIAGRSLALGVVLASAWSAALASGTVGVLGLLHTGVEPRPDNVVLGAVAGGMVVIAPALLELVQRAFSSPDTEARLA